MSTQSKIKTWQVIGVVRHAKANSPISGETEYLALQLRHKVEGKKITADVPQTKVFFIDSHPDYFDWVSEGYDLTNDKVTDTNKLKEIEAEGYQTTLKVQPFFIKNTKGEIVNYPEGHPDAGKPRIRNTRTVLILEGETEDDVRNIINSMNANNGSLVKFEETNLQEYHNDIAREILQDYNLGDEAGDGEQV